MAWRVRPACIGLGLACVLAAAPGAARAGGVSEFNGHLSIGYAKLFAHKAPGGSLSLSGGLARPVARGLEAGVGIGFHLLGSRTVVRGSLFATVDYSLFEAALLAHWVPESLGPVGRISVGPALLSPRAELSTSGGGLAFSDLAVEKIAPGVAVDATLMRRTTAPVRVGLEVGGRLAFLEPENWALATARLAFHY